VNLGDVYAKVVFNGSFIFENNFFRETSQKSINGLIVEAKDTAIICVKDDDAI